MTTIRTLCTVCLKPIQQEWPDQMTFGGVTCTATEYVAQALRSESVYIVCAECLAKMPDVRLEDMRLA